MKKILALLALIAASAVAQAQPLAGHPDARNDRMPSATVAEHHNSHAYKRAAHHRARHHHHRKHKHHHKM